MTDRRDLQLVLSSGAPIVTVQTTDEARFLEQLQALHARTSSRAYRPLFRWSVTDGLKRLDLALESQRHNAEPTEVLRHIRALSKPGIYALLDFHPFLEDPVNTRLLKDIAIAGRDNGTVVLLISHELDLPAELHSLSVRFEVHLPDAGARRAIVEALLERYQDEHPGAELMVDPRALDMLVTNLSGLSHADTQRLAKHAIFQDGAITSSDIPAVMSAKYELLNRSGLLSYEHDTVEPQEIAGFRNVKVWLNQRRLAFGDERPRGLDPPKGILILGVQGCGKSLAARAAASILGVSLLRLDFGALYNKYHGETERNLRESLKLSEVMSPCVLWLDEVEKGLAAGDQDGGTSRRVLGTLLTWMAERRSRVLLVATANDVRALPPELVRKGRFDEVFFVDLPSDAERAEILDIHLRQRGLDPRDFDLPALVAGCVDFSGAEIEQCVVAALYAAHALKQTVATRHVLGEIGRTRPLATLMGERVQALRAWASERTVPAHSGVTALVLE